MEYKEKIIKIINETLKDTPKIFLFGSRSCGCETTVSDIDIGIDCSRNLLLNELSDLKEKFEESNIIYKIDIVDFYDAEEKFKEIAYKKGLKIWQ